MKYPYTFKPEITLAPWCIPSRVHALRHPWRLDNKQGEHVAHKSGALTVIQRVSPAYVLPRRGRTRGDHACPFRAPRRPLNRIVHAVAIKIWHRARSGTRCVLHIQIRPKSAFLFIWRVSVL